MWVWEFLTQGRRGESSWLEPGAENNSSQQDVPLGCMPLSGSLGGALRPRALSRRTQQPSGGLVGLSLQLLLLPFFKDGSFRGMLMMPTRSSVGTRERRIDLIRRASPFPVWISCKARLKSQITETLTARLHPQISCSAMGFFSGQVCDCISLIA